MMRTDFILGLLVLTVVYNLRRLIRVLAVEEQPFVVRFLVIVNSLRFSLGRADDAENLRSTEGGKSAKWSHEDFLDGAALRHGRTFRNKDKAPFAACRHRVSVELPDAFFIDQFLQGLGKPAWKLHLEDSDSFDILISPENKLLFVFSLDLSLPDRDGDKESDPHNEHSEHED